MKPTKVTSEATDWHAAGLAAHHTGKWAVTMTKVRIRRALAKTRWQLVTFCGPNGGESAGIVDLLAVRKCHSTPTSGLKRGDLFEIVLIQVKGGTAAWPTDEDAVRLRKVGRFYKAKAVLLAEWKRGRQVQFFCLSKRRGTALSSNENWIPLHSLDSIFH